MITKCLLNLLVLILCVGIETRGQAQSTIEQDSLPISYNALLWEISGEGISKPSFLYGTIHAIPKDSFFILPSVEKSMQLSDRLVMELPMEMNFSTLFNSFQGMLMPQDQQLDQLLSTEDYIYLENFMRDSLGGGLPAMMYKMVKPIFTAQLISASYCEQIEQESYELYFQAEFQKMKKPISGLETVKDQMKALDEIPLKDQAISLMEAVRNPRASCGEYGELVHAYRQQNLGHLMKLVESEGELGNNLDPLLNNRNKKWIPLIEEMVILSGSLLQLELDIFLEKMALSNS